jgi:hypothetical protein
MAAVAARACKEGGVRRRHVVLLLAGLTLAVPAGASAHGRGATVALDYRLVLQPATKRLAGVRVAILDGDRSLRVTMSRGLLTLRGDLGEPMLRLSPAGAWANRASPTAAAEKLVASGRGWHQVSSGATYTWHEHRLSPPPYDASRTGPVAAFSIPGTLRGRPVELAGTFVRYRRPAVWPWLVGAVVVAAALALILALRPALRARATTVLGSIAGLAAVGTLTAFGVADAPNGRVGWAQIVLGGVLVAAVYVALARLRGVRRTQLAGLLGLASVIVSLGWVSAFWHGVVISWLSGAATRALLAIGLVAGATSLVASFHVEESS